jgi:hypothetical protein
MMRSIGSDGSHVTGDRIILRWRNGWAYVPRQAQERCSSLLIASSYDSIISPRSQGEPESVIFSL